MKNVLKKSLLAVTSALICVGLVFSMALSCIYNKAHMTQAFRTYAQETRDDVLVEDYETIAGEIITYLSSGAEEDIPILHDQVLFSEKENLHLKDCSNLTRAMGYGRFGAMFLVLVLFIWIMLEKDQDKRKVRIDEVFRGFGWGAGVLFAALLALGIWGVMDFESLFIAFHHAAFSNDLWILDPATDLLIQLMPFEFFVDYVKYILEAAAPALILIFAAPIANIVMAVKSRKAEKA